MAVPETGDEGDIFQQLRRLIVPSAKGGAAPATEDLAGHRDLVVCLSFE